MQNEAQWKPSKFDITPKGLKGSRDPRKLGIHSRLAADLSAKWYERVIPRYARGRFADLGCGTVPLYQLYRPSVDSITCIDWANSLHSINHIDIEHDLTKPLPVAENSFDTILLSSVIEHLPEPELIWIEMSRILSPGGHAILYVPFLYWLHEVPHDFYRFTEFALRRFAGRSKFEVVEMEPIGGAAEVITDIVCKAISPLRGGKTMARALQWMCLGFSSNKWGRRLTDRTSRKTPLAYGVVVRRS